MLPGALWSAGRRHLVTVTITVSIGLWLAGWIYSPLFVLSALVMTVLLLASIVVDAAKVCRRWLRPTPLERSATALARTVRSMQPLPTVYDLDIPGHDGHGVCIYLNPPKPRCTRTIMVGRVYRTDRDQIEQFRQQEERQEVATAVLDEYELWGWRGRHILRGHMGISSDDDKWSEPRRSLSTIRRQLRSRHSTLPAMLITDPAEMDELRQQILTATPHLLRRPSDG